MEATRGDSKGGGGGGMSSSSSGGGGGKIGPDMNAEGFATLSELEEGSTVDICAVDFGADD